MRPASYVLSLCLHLAAFLLIWFWPSQPPVRLDTPPVMISLVEGAPGGNRTPSPILGHMGEPAEGPKAPTPPAPKNEIAAPAREEARQPAPVPASPREAAPVKKPELKPEPNPAPKPEPRPAATPVAEKKQDPPKKKEPPRDEARKQEKKEEPKKTRQEQPQKRPSREDPVAAALQKARKATSRAESGDRGNAIEQAGGKRSEWYSPVEKKTDTVKLEGYDVIVVGLGGSGMSSYISAAENGAAVFGMETAGKIGGTSATVSGPMAINPKTKMDAQNNGEKFLEEEGVSSCYVDFEVPL